ncbi:MAG TPA: hypothetical protein PK358_01105 [Spirochaetota bacterium]|nr:hypothetical protein [Spirochaetota bacterium]HPJ33398.1 hypothetical protein [Spirochaetota bacterium]
MSGFTILSFPAEKNDNLLSLTAGRSRYMLPIGGRFRVIDFTIRNSISSGASSTILFTNIEDNLQDYVNEYQENSAEEETGELKEKGHPIEVHSFDNSEPESLLETITASDSSYFVLYNGDNPSIIDLSSIFEKFRSSKKKGLLVKLRINGKTTMAQRVVISHKKTLTGIIKKSLKDKHRSPNFFEMIINSLIHSGISSTTVDACYWQISSVTEYYNLNREIIWNSEISNLLYRDRIIKSQIKSNRFARLDEKGSIKNSFISDYCYINGKVENSIIFPGVDIEEDALVKDSIILPFVKIGRGASVINAIIDESTEFEERYIAGPECRIGTEEKFMKNSNFPSKLYSSITLIGRDNYIPANVFIGSACYLAESTAENYFKTSSRLEDGESVTEAEKAD